METMTICGNAYPISGYVDSEKCGEHIPVVDIPMMSDFRWQLTSLQSRLENPELYRTQLGEDVEATITMLRQWLEEHIQEAGERDRPLLKRLGMVSA